MQKHLFVFALLLLSLTASAQGVTSTTSDHITARQRLRIGTDTSKYFTSIVTAFPVTQTHRQLPSALAVRNFIAAWPLTGDLTGTLSAPVVDGLQGRPVAATAPSSGQVLKWNGSSWEPAADGGTTYTGGTGINITGTVISNTGDLSNTNELQTLSVASNTATLSNSGGSVTIAGAGINTVSTAGSTITVTATEVDGSVTNEIELPSQTGNAGRYLTTNGTTPSWGTISGTGTVTSVGLSLPGQFSVSGSPVTTSGTLTAAWANQSPNLVFAGPASGLAAAPGFRSLVAADLAGTGVLTGTFTSGQIPYATGSNTLTGSNKLFYDVSNNRVRVNTGSFLTSSALEVFKSYTNTTDVNISLTGSIPLLSWRNGQRRFSLGTGYTANDELSLLGTTTDNDNPTSVLWKWFSNGNIEMYGSRMLLNFGRINAGTTGNSFGATAAPSGVGFFVSLPSGERARFQAVSGLAYIDFYTPASGANRNYSFATGWATPGDFLLLRGTAAGADPSSPLLYFNNGLTAINTTSPAAKFHIVGDGATSGTYSLIATNSSGSTATAPLAVRDDGQVGIGTNAPARVLHVVGNMRLTGSAGTSTLLLGRDANGDISNIATGASTGQVLQWNGTTWVPATLSLTDTNFGNTNLTVSANRTHTFTNNTVTFDASGATIATSTPLIIRGKADGTNSTQFLTIQNAGGSPLFSGTTTNTTTTLEVAAGSKLRAGAGALYTAFTDEGSIELHQRSTDASSAQAGEIWWNNTSERLRIRNSAQAESITTYETDIKGSEAFITASTSVLQGANRFVQADANTNSITLTAGAALIEGQIYTIRCRRNSVNAITINADTANGFSLGIDGDSALTPSSYTCTNYEIIHLRRFGSVILVDK